MNKWEAIKVGKITISGPRPIKMRAKQFMMFDALKGLKEAIAEKEQQFSPKRELTGERMEEINRTLIALQTGDIVTVTYYCQYGRNYRQLSGVVGKIDLFWKEIQIGAVSIYFSEIYEIICHNNAEI